MDNTLWLRLRSSKKARLWTLISILALLVLAGGIWQVNTKFAALNHQISTLTQENALIESDGVRVQFAQYTNSVGLYEATNEKMTTDQTQGVDVSTIAPQMTVAINLILGAQYSAANTLLTSLSGQLDALLKAKQTAAAAPKAAPSTTSITAPKAKGSTSGSCGVPGVGGYCHLTVKTSSGSFSTYITAVSAGQVSTDTDNSSDCADNCPVQSLASYVSQDGASAGMHGTYFCPSDYSSCASDVNSYNYPVWNTRLGKWLNQGNLPLSNRAMMAFTSSSVVFYPQANSYSGLGGLRAAIVNQPGLVSGGQDIVGNYTLTSDQLVEATRGGIAARGSTVYFVISTDATVPEFAQVMVAIGADSALNLDGGGSAAMMYHGKYEVGPGRTLPNAITAN